MCFVWDVLFEESFTGGLRMLRDCMSESRNWNTTLCLTDIQMTSPVWSRSVSLEKKNRITIQELKEYSMLTQPHSRAVVQPNHPAHKVCYKQLRCLWVNVTSISVSPKQSMKRFLALKTETSIEKNPSILDYFMSPGKKLPLRHQLMVGKEPVCKIIFWYSKSTFQISFVHKHSSKILHFKPSWAIITQA